MTGYDHDEHPTEGTAVVSILQIRAFIDARLAQLEREYHAAPARAANGVGVAVGRAVIAGQQMALRDLKRRIENSDGAARWD